MSETITLPAPILERAASSRTKWEREYQAFQLMLPQLLQTMGGLYVAIHEERVIDSDRDELALIGRVLARIGNVAIHVGLVTDRPERVHRSGVVRDLFPARVPEAVGEFFRDYPVTDRTLREAAGSLREGMRQALKGSQAAP